MNYKEMIIKEWRTAMDLDLPFEDRKEALLNLHVELWADIYEKQLKDKLDSCVIRLIKEDGFRWDFLRYTNDSCFLCVLDCRGGCRNCPLASLDGIKGCGDEGEPYNSWVWHLKNSNTYDSQGAFEVMDLKGTI